MNIGKLYKNNGRFWFLYPSKDIAVTAATATRPAATTYADDVAAYLSKHFKCNVSYIKPNSVFCLLEKDGEFIKVLSTNGEVGWIILDDWCKNYIEEVKV